jgi:hypothetical protein
MDGVGDVDSVIPRVDLQRRPAEVLMSKTPEASALTQRARAVCGSTRSLTWNGPLAGDSSSSTKGTVACVFKPVVNYVRILGVGRRS